MGEDIIMTERVHISDSAETTIISCDALSWNEHQTSEVAIRPVPTRNSGSKVDTSTHVLNPRELRLKIRATEEEKTRLDFLFDKNEIIYIWGINVTRSWIYAGWFNQYNLIWEYSDSDIERNWLTDIKILCDGTSHPTALPYGFKAERLLNGDFGLGNACGWIKNSAGGFTGPNKVSVGSDYVYVTSGTIKVFDVDNLNYIGGKRYYNSSLLYCHGVDLYGDYLYVTETNNNKIIKLTVNGLYCVDSIGSYGSGNDQFKNPYGVYCDGTYLYIVEYDGHRLMKRKLSDLSYVSKIGSDGNGNDQFHYPYDITGDGTYLYIVDKGNHRIVKRLASDLSYISKIGSYGSGNDQFNNPRGICNDGTYLYIADTSNDRIVKRKCSDLSYVSEFSSINGDSLNNPYGVDEDGTYLYVTDWDNYRLVKILKSDFSYVDEVGGSYAPIPSVDTSPYQLSLPSLSFVEQDINEVEVDDMLEFSLDMWALGWYSPPETTKIKITVYYTDDTTTEISVSKNSGVGAWEEVDILSYLTAGKTVNKIKIEENNGSSAASIKDVTLTVS